jgi:hypothetical protein
MDITIGREEEEVGDVEYLEPFTVQVETEHR